MIAIANSYALPLLLAAAVLKALGQGCGSPAIQAESVKILGDKRSGVAVSTCLIGQNIGNAIGPIIGNQLIVSYGYTFVFYTMAALMMMGLLLFRFCKNTNISKNQ